MFSVFSFFQVSLTTTDHSGKTALHYCVENKNNKIATLLLETDCSMINVQDNEGYSALHLAVISGNKTMIDTLLKKGADINCVDMENHTVAHWATGKY